MFSFLFRHIALKVLDLFVTRMYSLFKFINPPNILRVSLDCVLKVIYILRSRAALACLNFKLENDLIADSEYQSTTPKPPPSQRP